MRSPLDPGLLSQVPLFAGVDLSSAGDALRTTALVSLGRDEVLFRQGDESSGFFFVRDGRIRLTATSRGGTTTTVEIVGAGETFGEAVVFLEHPYPVTASALLDSTLYFISAPLVDAMLTNDPRTARRLLANLSKRNHGLVADLAALRLESATSRVSAYLLRSCPTPVPDGPVDIDLLDAKKVIADRLSLTPESLSRALRRLTDRGAIEVRSRTIRVHPEILAAQV